MFDPTTMRGLREAIAAFAAGFDAGALPASAAARVVEDAAAAEHMLATVKALAAHRVAETELWRREGDVSAAHQLARTTGTSVGQARATLETAGRLGSLPALDAAARRGEISPAQAAPIAEAASRAPAAEVRLVETAARASLGELLDECTRVKAAAEPDDEARHRAIHRSRCVRTRRTADGAGELTYRSTVDEVAEVEAIVRGFADRAFRTAWREGRREPAEAYLADGLLAAVRAAVARGGGAGGDAPSGQRPPRPAKVLVRIDWEALVRGWPADGEVSEIAGLGPVPVSAVRAMVGSGDAFLAAVVTKGQDVVNVAHLGRRPTAAQLSGLEWRDPSCTALGCTATVRLETDHRVDWAASRITLLGLLDRCCAHHHDLKTYSGWAFVEGSGKRLMVPPDDPRHPQARHGPAPPREVASVASVASVA